MTQVISTHTMHEEDTAYALPEFNIDRIQMIDQNTMFIPLGVLGNANANKIFGNAEANWLNGGAGQDTMAGGAGGDSYFVDDAGDVIIEAADGGIDHVNANVSYVLSANIENLYLGGSNGPNGPTSWDNINGTGNALDNFISGNHGSNHLIGLEGNDTLMGGGMDGADTLEGGSGNDVYYADGNDTIIEADNGGIDTVWVYGTDFDFSKLKNVEIVKFFENTAVTTNSTPVPPNVDAQSQPSKDAFIFDDKLSKKTSVKKIADFDVKNDTLCLSKEVFKKIAKKGDLSKAAFYSGTKAHDASDRIIYDKKTGVVSYDADGKGGAAAIKFAKIDAGLKLTADHFLVI
ncbi:calcium-binding protein [Microvirga sp. ACRRW]|uniref:calcium-binding protein n=1 Tax=Microvirga sp. ACRRW TaxID=2918205 RepID=UPI001EF533DC|nr:calcium-binding protein [Microvirga sp. ACRRW]MCG7392082.1 calcium-binding protein [Microvirga sp. ACRRW]